MRFFRVALSQGLHYTKELDLPRAVIATITGTGAVVYRYNITQNRAYGPRSARFVMSLL